MRIMAIDYGTHRLGLAISDELGLTAQALEVYQRRGRAADLAYLATKAKELGAEMIVVGLPLNMNGTQGPAASAAKRFGRALERVSGLAVDFADERLTTVAAARGLRAMEVPRGRRREVVDKTAAALILQGYLDRIHGSASAREEREE
ncbi:MAG: Holliday junction resolvase RuvX [Firmicutes bacterium]|nr:Holliday junction resolvase RuvX [Bacillota bacterium]